MAAREGDRGQVSVGHFVLQGKGEGKMTEKKKAKKKRGRKPMYPKLGKMSIYGFAAPPAFMKRWKKVAKAIGVPFGVWLRRLLTHAADRHENMMAKKAKGAQKPQDPRPEEVGQPE